MFGRIPTLDQPAATTAICGNSASYIVLGAAAPPIEPDVENSPSCID